MNFRKMSFRNSTSENDCPFTSQSIELAFGPEVSLFLHCHLRGYDRYGQGIHGDHGNLKIYYCCYNIFIITFDYAIKNVLFVQHAQNALST